MHPGPPGLRRSSEARQRNHRCAIAEAAREGVELAAVAHRVDERVEPLQQVRVAAPDADAEMRRAQGELLLVLLALRAAARVDLAVVAAAHGVDLAGHERGGDRGTVV